MITIKEIKSSDIFSSPNWDEIQAEYSSECSISMIGRINPQQQVYDLLEKNGSMRCFGAYAGEKLIGFSTLLVYLNPHYGVHTAVIESIFVSKAYRSTGAGRDMIVAIKQYAKESGCVATLASAPVGSMFESVMEGSKEWKRTNSVFCMSL